MTRQTAETGSGVATIQATATTAIPDMEALGGGRRRGRPHAAEVLAAERQATDGGGSPPSDGG